MSRELDGSDNILILYIFQSINEGNSTTPQYHIVRIFSDSKFFEMYVQYVPVEMC